MNQEDASKLLEKQSVPPAFKNTNFFDQDIVPMLNKLPTALEFLRIHARDSTAPCPSKFVCFGVGCEESFVYEGDWRVHMLRCKHAPFICGWCGSDHQFTTFEAHLAAHLLKCKDKPSYLMHIKRTCKQNFICDCGKAFPLQKYLNRLKKEFCVNKDKKPAGKASAQTRKAAAHPTSTRKATALGAAKKKNKSQV